MGKDHHQHDGGIEERHIEAPVRTFVVMRSSYCPYEAWSVRDAGVIAPKVEVRDNSSDQRGLFATQAIFPGERLLFLPHTALIGEHMLRSKGKEILKRRRESFDLDDAIGAEDWATGMIEELRQMLASDEENAVKTVAENVRYEWRSDDGVALYLVACRAILQRGNASAGVLGENEEHVTEPIADDVVPLVDDLVPVQAISEPVVSDGQVAELLQQSVDIVAYKVDSAQETQTPSFLPHVAMLPQTFPSSPLYYSPDELSPLEGTNCHGYVTLMLNQIETDWSQLAQIIHTFCASSNCKMKCKQCQEGLSCKCQVLDPNSIFTMEAYKWALCNVYSRSTDFVLFGQDGEEEKRRVVAPLFDMMNHDFESHITHAMDEDGNLSAYNESDASIEPGSEICLNYGNFPNEKFLLIYGFVIPGNPFDAVDIYAPIQPSDPMYQVKARLLSTKCGIDDVNLPHKLLRSQIATNAILPSSLLSVLRVVGIQSAEEVIMLASREGFQDGIDMISYENEKSALYALGHALHIMARQLALNLISDDNLRTASNLSHVPPRAMVTIAEEDIEADEEHEPSQPTPSQALASVAVEERRRHGGVNILNTKILCQSEYAILQVALSEIAERLEKLETLPSTDVE